MRLKYFSFLFILFLLFSNCQNKKHDTEFYLNKGNQITVTTQAVLLKNVSDAMGKGGPVNAVDFCSAKASKLLDSLIQDHDYEIYRITERNRNPENILKTDADKAIWEHYLITKAEFAKDTLISESNNLVYYKPIRLKLPACLKCHGIPYETMDSATVLKINEIYPNDKARFYQEGDLRGMWKVVFNP